MQLLFGIFISVGLFNSFGVDACESRSLDIAL
jgi:hypothetical protein